MQYTEYEIVREYNSAKYRNKNIGVLAQLNCVSRKEIIEILERNGVTIPQKYKDSKVEEYNMFDENEGKHDKKPLEKPVETPQSPKNRNKEPKKSENITSKSDSIHEETKSDDMSGEVTYHLVQRSRARIESHLNRIERKQKKLKRLYKQLANLILG